MMRTIVVAFAGYLALLPALAHGQTFAGWSLVETPHFRLQFPPNPQVEPKEYADQLERAHVELQRILGPLKNPPRRIEVRSVRLQPDP